MISGYKALTIYISKFTFAFRGALLRRRSNLVMIRGVVYKSHWQASSHKIRRHPFAEGGTLEIESSKKFIILH